MSTELIELVKDLIDFNSYKEKKYTLKEYLIQVLNYNIEEAEDIVIIYNLEMKYS